MNKEEIEKLPEQIKDASLKAQQIANTIPTTDKLIAQLELEATAQAAGKNETERKVARENQLAQNTNYQTALRQRQQLKEEFAAAQIEVAYQRDRLTVAKILAELKE